MKIAFVTELLYPSIGGQEVRFLELGQKLASRGHDVTIYTIRHDLKTLKFESYDELKVIRIADCPNYKTKIIRRNPLGILNFTFRLLLRINELNSFDHVIFNIWPILPAIILGPKLKSKVLIDICETRSGALWNYIYRKIATVPRSRIIGVSPEIIRQMRLIFGVSVDRSHILVSGVDITNIPNKIPIKKEKMILFFGRLTTHKNPELLANAFINSDMPDNDYRLIFAGGGELLAILKDKFRHSKITFLGQVSEEEKWDLLSRASLLVLPSRREGFPRVVSEGACQETPTLTLDFLDNGTRFVVKDFNLGYSVAPSMESLISALNEFVQDPNKILQDTKDLGSRARNEFGWENVCLQFEKFLTQTDR